MSNSLRPHELQHPRPPCPSPTPGVHSNARPSSLWCHPAISSSVVPFYSCPQSLPASESFPMSQLFAGGGQSTGVQLQAGFRKGRGTRDQIANIRWIIEKAREFQKNIYFCFIHYAKAFDCVAHNKLWKILKEMRTPGHLICFLRNLYAGQETTVRTGHGTTNWFQIGESCILSPCLFNFYVEYPWPRAWVSSSW